MHFHGIENLRLIRLFCMRLFESAILETLKCTMCVVWVVTSSRRKGGAGDGLMDTLHIYSDNCTVPCTEYCAMCSTVSCAVLCQDQLLDSVCKSVWSENSNCLSDVHCIKLILCQIQHINIKYWRFGPQCQRKGKW